MACSAATMQIASLSGLVSTIAASQSVCQPNVCSGMAALPAEECQRYLGLGRHFRHGKGGFPLLGVLYETPAHPSDIENTFARRLVLASRFRGSSLRLPLSGLVYREIATHILDIRASLNSRRGTEGGRGP